MVIDRQFVLIEIRRLHYEPDLEELECVGISAL